MSPFDAPGEWLRCALHAHTTNSDGELAPELLVRHYDWAGYDVLAITDHWFRTAEASTKTLLVIPSTELNAVVGDEEDVHVLGLGVESDPGARAGDPHRRSLQRRRRGAVQPGRVGDALLRPHARSTRERRPARLSQPQPHPRARRRRADHARRAPASVGRRRVRPGRGEGGRR